MSYQKIGLNGTWQIAAGTRQPDHFPDEIPVPALVDVAFPDWPQYDYFWYRQIIQLPPLQPGQRVVLQLEQVMFGTEIWLNHQKIGGDIPCYTSQESDLTGFARPGQNELRIRVGQKHTLPPHSAVGNDFEKLSWIPGIWGDLWVHIYQGARLHWTRIIPDIETGTVRLTSQVGSFGTGEPLALHFRIHEKNSREPVAGLQQQLAPDFNGETDAELKIPEFRLWSPEDPFLYVLECELRCGERTAHLHTLPFGMRQFEIRNGRFYLNGQRRVLLGGNIPFHRLLSDDTRGTLPWQTEWIKKALVEIPRQHNMKFFRFHLGHAYNRWYDAADEHGILLQDEWMFWTTTGSREQIEKELTAWIRENGHHPSIIIWDALNESQDEFITGGLIPQLKKMDPTRPWETVDFPEDHPYIYSLGPVLTDRPFGYSRPAIQLGGGKKPAVVNEYCWWWLDDAGRPTPLTQEVVARWLGKENPSTEELLQHQCFLISELTEFWRRQNLDGIMPFVYLSARRGATANWFFGELAELRPKPVLEALRNAFAPLGLSLELWDRHFLTSEQREIGCWLFNDTEREAGVSLQLQWGETIFETKSGIRLAAGEHRRETFSLRFPKQPGQAVLKAVLRDENEKTLALSQKTAFVFPPPELPAETLPAIALHDPMGEMAALFNEKKIPFKTLQDSLADCELLFVNAGGMDEEYQSCLETIGRFVESGGILILQEPEFGITGSARLPVLPDLALQVQQRDDPDRGGYDSVVFPENRDHPLWQGIKAEHLHFFNGGLGGEMVSRHNLQPSRRFGRLAACHLHLLVAAVLEIPVGKGWVIVSRVQLRGRLLRNRQETALFARRYDPVAERLLGNLLVAWMGSDARRQELQRRLEEPPLYISGVEMSQGQILTIGKDWLDSRWLQNRGREQWLEIEFDRTVAPDLIRLEWEIAQNIKWRLMGAPAGKSWELLEKGESGKNEQKIFRPAGGSYKYLKLEFLELGDKWGHSHISIHFSGAAE
ncbi:MAG: sugar-binding domain-containing protein [Calditrichia bacterium]